MPLRVLHEVRESVKTQAKGSQRHAALFVRFHAPPGPPPPSPPDLHGTAKDLPHTLRPKLIIFLRAPLWPCSDLYKQLACKRHSDCDPSQVLSSQVMKRAVASFMNNQNHATAVFTFRFPVVLSSSGKFVNSIL